MGLAYVCGMRSICALGRGFSLGGAVLIGCGAQHRYLFYQPIEGWPREFDPPAQPVRHDLLTVWPADLVL